MLQTNVLETKNSLSHLLHLLESGQEDCVIVARHNKPVAKIVPLKEEASVKRIGAAKAKKLYLEDWDSDDINSEVASLFGISEAS